MFFSIVTSIQSEHDTVDVNVLEVLASAKTPFMESLREQVHLIAVKYDRLYIQRVW